MDENSNHSWQTVWHGNLTGAKHGDESPAHLTGTLRGEGGYDVVSHRKESAGNIFRSHSFVFRQNFFEQFTRGLQYQFWFISCDGGRATDSTNWHTLLLTPPLAPPHPWRRTG